jgi:ribosomal RNA-processing protein 7
VGRRAGAPRSRKVKVKKQTELKGFYRFQIKEEKMRDLESLRKKFAEDKERVAKMKDQRKFKPF